VSVVVDVVLQILSATLGDLLGISLTSRRSSSAAKKLLLTEGRVRTSIRAIDGRVLNICTEWSGGMAVLSPAHIRFEPIIGIVGDREIGVVRLRLSSLPIRDLPVTSSPAKLLVVTTASGELYWLVPTDLVDQIVERLHPAGTTDAFA